MISSAAFLKGRLKTAKFLYRYQNTEWDEDKLNRYLDKLYNTPKEAVQQISFEHNLKVMDQDVSVFFYDVTILYF